MGKEMLREFLGEAKISILEDDQTNGKPMTIKGVAGKSGIINQNDRFYSNIAYTKAVEKAQYRIKNNKLLGEVDHPEYGQGSLHRSAIRFTKLEMQGDDMMFEGVVLPTPHGKVLEGLLRGGVGVGMSTRGYASVNYQEIDGREIAYIGDDYEIDGIDAVLDQSNPFGKVQSFESKGGKIVKTIEELKQAYPDLMNQFEEGVKSAIRESVTAEVKEGLEKEFDNRLATAVEERKEEIRKEILESEEMTKQKAVIDSVLSALGDFAPKAQTEVTESVQAKELKKLQESFTAMNEKVSTLEKENNDLKAEKVQAQIQESVRSEVEKKLAGERFATQIRPHLEGCQTVEEVSAKFESAKKLVESIMEAQGVKVEGQGQKVNENENRGQVSPEIERQKRLAGIL